MVTGPVRGSGGERPVGWAPFPVGHVVDGGRVRELRRERCLTQAALGARLGVGQDAISKVESGRIGRPEYLAELAAIFGLRDVDLLVLPVSGGGPGRSGVPGAGGAPGTRAGDGPAGEPAFWTVPETAAVLRISRHLVYRLVRAGDLKAERAGRSWRIAAASIRAYLADPARTPVDAEPARRDRASLLPIDRDRLRGLRSERGWTQLELARRAGLSMGRVSELETGHHKRTSAIPALARALGVPPAELEPHAQGQARVLAALTGEDAGGAGMPVHAGGARLREVRLRTGMTQAALARRAGISRSYLSTIERGHRDRPDLIPALARALNVPSAELAAPVECHQPRSAPALQRAL